MDTLQIFLVDPDPSSSSKLAREVRAVCESGEAIVTRHEAAKLLASFKTSVDRENHLCYGAGFDPDVVILILPDVIGDRERDLILLISKHPSCIPIIALLNDTSGIDMMELFQLGIMDFITPPIRSKDVVPRIWRLAEHARKRNALFQQQKTAIGMRRIIGTAPAFKAQTEKIPLIAGCDATVLITGETGTGKEMFARAIHYLSARSNKAFTPVNCGAIPPELIENEFFGHARGAFTSAAVTTEGIIHHTNGGTLFLDEIGCLTLSAQVKFLRFLEEKEYRQLGSAKTRRADIRIIAATNIDIEKAVASGKFRGDLCYRLNIIPLNLPPLRQRQEDIPVLAGHFVEQYALELNKMVDGMTSKAMQKLLLYDWPGNVRELRNVIERAVVFATGPMISEKEIIIPGAQPNTQTISFQEAKANAVARFEKDYIRGLLISHQGNITRAAQSAGKNRRAFWELIRKYAIDIRPFKNKDLGWPDQSMNR